MHILQLWYEIYVICKPKSCGLEDPCSHPMFVASGCEPRLNALDWPRREFLWRINRDLKNVRNVIGIFFANFSVSDTTEPKPKESKGFVNFEFSPSLRAAAIPLITAIGCFRQNSCS